MALAWLGLALGQPLGQEPQIEARAAGPFRFVALPDLARALGASFVAGGDVFTLRAEHGVLTVFAGTPDALWQARGAAAPLELSSFAPPRYEDGVWFVPEDLLGVLGVRLEGEVALLPDGRRWPLRVPALAVSAPGVAEVFELAPAVPALRLFAAVGEHEHALSLLAVDLAMLALAYPEQQAALDAQLRSLAGERVLLVIISSLVEARIELSFVVRQAAAEAVLTSPLDVQVLSGDPARVVPGEPLAAALFLPAGFDLRSPLTLEWLGVRGTIALRR